MLRWSDACKEYQRRFEDEVRGVRRPATGPNVSLAEMERLCGVDVLQSEIATLKLKLLNEREKSDMIDSLTRERDELAAALRNYGDHHYWCDGGDSESGCPCGWRTARDKIDAALAAYKNLMEKSNAKTSDIS